MKYAIIIPDGCADWPIKALGGRTPMQAAATPNLDALARSGLLGRSKNVPETLDPGSDVATLSLLGYDPVACYTGRAPLEAAAMGIAVGPDDWVFRCNTVTLRDGIMENFTADHISSAESAELIAFVQDRLPEKTGYPVRFFPGVGYRNLMLWSGDATGTETVSSPFPSKPPFDETTRTVPPHDWTGRAVLDKVADGAGAEILRGIFHVAGDLLRDHPVNRRRIAVGKMPCTHFWLWGQGRRPRIPTFTERFSDRLALDRSFAGAMITAVDLLRGIARHLGWDVLDVPGATGYVDTDYAAKGRYAAEALARYDLVCVHVEAPDESGHEGDFAKKIASMEAIDAEVVPPIVEALKRYGAAEGWRLLVSPDHPTPCEKKTHTRDEVPWLWVGSDVPADTSRSYDEVSSEASERLYPEGWRMMTDFLAARTTAPERLSEPPSIEAG